LDQVEKVAAKKVPSDRTLTKTDLQLKFAEIKMGEPNLMEPPLDNAPEGAIGKGPSAQEIKT
jgi:hypothetical protein